MSDAGNSFFTKAMNQSDLLEDLCLLPLENNLAGPGKKCQSLEASLEAICKSKENRERGRDFCQRGKLSLRAYGTVTFTGFEWETTPHGVDVDWTNPLNAFLFLHYLIAYHAESSDPKAIQLAMEGITSWLDAYAESDESYPHKYVWSDMVTAYRAERMVSFLVYMAVHDPAWPARHNELRGRVLRAVWKHVEILCKDSFYFKHSNHGLGQTKILLLLAVFFSLPPQHPQQIRGHCSLRDMARFLAANKRKRINLARARLLDELQHTFTDEGVHIENSPGYSTYVFNRFLDIVQNYPATVPGNIFLESFHRLVPLFLESLARMIRPDGCLPILGDTVSEQMRSTYRECGDCEPRLWLEYVVSAGVKGKPAPGLQKIYPKSGYAIFRNAWPDSADGSGRLHCVVKAGSLSRVHYHRDEGHVLLFAYDEDWLIDSGQYNYAERTPERRYMRSREAHNVPIISPDAEYVPHFEDRFKSWTISDWNDSDDAPFVKMDFSVMEKVRHSRTVRYFPKEERIHIEDDFFCTDGLEREVTLLWHTPADKRIDIADGRSASIASRRGTKLLLEFPETQPVWLDSRCGRDGDLIFSLFSDAYGTIEDSRVIRSNFILDQHLRVVSSFQFIPCGEAERTALSNSEYTDLPSEALSGFFQKAFGVARRKKQYALITVDTEALPRRASSDHVTRLIWGEHDNGTAGVREMCAIGDEFGAKHVFFVDMCGAYARCDEIRDVVRWLDGVGQDVQLHAHPEYLPKDFWPQHNFSYYPRYMNQYADDKDDFVINHFGRMISNITGKPLQAFRAGSFRWNAGTLRALAKNHIPLSFNNSMCAMHNEQCLYSLPTNDPFRWSNGIIEIPMTEKKILRGLGRDWWARLQYPQSKLYHYRPWWASFIPGSVSHRTPVLVFLLHSWSLLSWDENGYGVYKNDAPLEGYRKLLRHLSKEYDIIDTTELLYLIEKGIIPLPHTEDLAQAELCSRKE